MTNTTVTLPKPTVARRSVSKKGENRATSADVGIDFGRFFGRPTIFFVKALKLKVSLTDPPIFRGFVFGEASGNGRPIIGRQSADFLNIFNHDIGRLTPDHRASIGRRSPDGRSMTFYRKTVGRQTPDIGRHSADDRPTVGRS